MFCYVLQKQLSSYCLWSDELTLETYISGFQCVVPFDFLITLVFRRARWLLDKKSYTLCREDSVYTIACQQKLLFSSYSVRDNVYKRVNRYTPLQGIYWTLYWVCEYVSNNIIFNILILISVILSKFIIFLKCDCFSFSSSPEFGMNYFPSYPMIFYSDADVYCIPYVGGVRSQKVWAEG